METILKALHMHKIMLLFKVYQVAKDLVFKNSKEKISEIYQVLMKSHKFLTIFGHFLTVRFLLVFVSFSLNLAQEEITKFSHVQFPRGKF